MSNFTGKLNGIESGDWTLDFFHRFDNLAIVSPALLRFWRLSFFGCGSLCIKAADDKSCDDDNQKSNSNTKSNNKNCWYVFTGLNLAGRWGEEKLRNLRVQEARLSKRGKMRTVETVCASCWRIACLAILNGFMARFATNRFRFKIKTRTAIARTLSQS